MSQSKLVRVFLGLNATFSALSGTFLILAPQRAASWILTEPADPMPLLLRFLGVGTVIFALALLLLLNRAPITRRPVTLIILADLGWVIVSVALLLFAGHLFTHGGALVVAAVAALVAVFAAGQHLGAARLPVPASRVEFRTRGGALEATVRRVVAAPPETVWRVMNDHPGYADVASNLSKVEVLSGNGLGLRRQCYGPKGESWTETCDLFEEGRAFGFRVHTEAPGYPYPFAGLSGRWSVAPLAEGAEFSIVLTARAKGNAAARAIFGVVARMKFRPVLTELAEAWAHRMEAEAQARRRPAAR